MYAIQKLAIKMAPRIITHPELIPVALVIGAVALYSDAKKVTQQISGISPPFVDP